MDIAVPSADVRLADAACAALFRTLQERGSIINHTTKVALAAVLNCFEGLLTGRLTETQHYLASLDPGKGKTEAICTFLRIWKDHGFAPDGGVLIGLSRKEEIRSYIRRAGLAPEDYAVLTADPALNGAGRPDRSEARVLFTTQEMLYRRLDGISFAEQACFHYRGRPRSLRVWDETLLPAKPVRLRCDELGALLAPLRPRAPEVAGTLEGFLASAAAAVGSTVTIPQALSVLTADGLSQQLAKALPDTKAYKAERESLAMMVGEQMVVEKSNRDGLVLVGAGRRLPADFAPAVILDASGRVLQSYRDWEKHAGGLAWLPAAANDYSRLDIHLWDRSASCSTFKKPEDREGILQAVADVINQKPDESWLVIHHMAKDGYDAPKDLRALLERPEAVEFLHWGNHHGTNDYRNIRNVVVLGLWNYPDELYAAHHIAASGLLATHVDKAARRALRTSEHQHHLLQAICRSAVRNSSQGVCGDCTVYMVGKPSRDSRSLLEETFPGCAVHDWSPVAPTLTGRAQQVVEELRRRFADPEVLQVRKSEVGAAVGFAQTQGLSQVLRREDVRAVLSGQGLAVTRWDFVRAA